MEKPDMLVERKFVAAAAVLSFTLAACGGGSSDPAGAAVANAADPTSVVDVAKHPALVSGTVIPPATSISDSSGAVWTVKNGVVYRANVAAGFSLGSVEANAASSARKLTGRLTKAGLNFNLRRSSRVL